MIQLFMRTSINQTTSWLVQSWSTFDAQTHHEQTQTHKTHHNPDLGEPPPSPLYYVLCVATKLAPKWHFVSRFASGSPEIPKVGIFTTLGAHNFVCRPSIEMRSKEKLQPLSRAFQWYVAQHLNAGNLGRFLTFSGWESNCQFDSRPFFWP